MSDHVSDLVSEYLAFWVDQRLEGSSLGADGTDPTGEDELVETIARAVECSELLDDVWPADSTPSHAAPRSEASAMESATGSQGSGNGQSVLRSDSQAETEPKPSREKFGRFQIRGLLGRGGMGTVLLAFDPAIGRQVALKIPHPGMMIDGRNRDRFLQEARAAGDLRHPNVVPVFEAGEFDDVCYIASEHCDGPTLAEWLRQRASEEHSINADAEAVEKARPNNQTAHEDLSIRQAAWIVAQLAAAVQHAHDRGIVHRDLKPGNVLLDPCLVENPEDNFGFIPRITDFGLARVEATDNTALTNTGATLGTAEYMAPEQATGDGQAVGPHSDQFALGVILYQLLTGVSPFKRATMARTLGAVEREEPPALRRLLPKLPHDLEAICLNALQKDPDQRYDRVGEFAEDLHRFLRGESVRARTPGQIERAWKWCRRHPAWAALSIVSTLSLVTVLSMTLWHNHRLAEMLATSERSERDAQLARSDAIQQKERLRREVYALDMSAAIEAWTSGWTEEVERLLGKQLPKEGESDHRGSEWRLLKSLVSYPPPVVLSGHEGPVWEVTLHPDGRRLISAGQDGTVRVWDIESAKQLRAIQCSANSLHALAISPDGTKFATGNRNLELWELESGNKLGVIARHDATIEEACFSHDGTFIASGSRYEDVQLSSLDGTSLASVPGGTRNESLAFVSSGERIMVMHEYEYRGKSLGIWNCRTHQKMAELQPINISVNTFALSDDERYLAVGNHSSDIAVLNTTTQQEITGRLRSRTKFNDIAFSPTSEILAGGGDDGILKYWRIELDDNQRAGTSIINQMTSVPAHEGSVSSLAFVHDRSVATCGEDGLIKLWSISPTDRLVYNMPKSFNSLDFAPDGGSLVATADNGDICFASTRSKSVVSRVHVADAGVRQVAWAPDGRRIAVGTDDGRVLMWNQELKRVEGVVAHKRNGTIRRATFSPDGRLLATASSDRHLRVWQVDHLAEVASVEFSDDSVRSVAFSADGRYLAGGCQGNEMIVVDTQTWQEAWRLLPRNPTTTLDFSPDGRLLASGHDDASIRLWSMDSGAQIGVLKGHERAVHSLEFSPGGQTLASGSNDRTLRLWNIPTLRQLGVLLRHPNRVTHVAFSPDGSQLAAAGNAEVGTIIIFTTDR